MKLISVYLDFSSFSLCAAIVFEKKYVEAVRSIRMHDFEKVYSTNAPLFRTFKIFVSFTNVLCVHCYENDAIFSVLQNL